MMILPLVVPLVLYYVPFGTSFRISSFQTSRRNAGVHQMPPMRSLSSTKEITPTAAQEDSAINRLFKSIEFNNTRWMNFTRSTDFKYKDVADLDTRWSWTYNSCALDGSSIALNDTETILSQSTTLGGLPVSDYLDTLAHGHALDLLNSALHTRTHLSKHLLNSLNKHLVRHVKYIEVIDREGNDTAVLHVPGQYRQTPFLERRSDGSVKEYTTPEQIEAQMDKLIDFCNNPPADIHVVEAAARAHLQFMRIHPYQTGNLREAHLLLGFLLMQQGYLPPIVSVDRKEEYFHALDTATDEDPSAMVTLVAESLDRMLSDTIEFFTDGWMLDV